MSEALWEERQRDGWWIEGKLRRTLMSVLASFVQPSREMVEGLTASDVVDQKCTSCSTVVGTSDGAEGFLPSLSTPRQQGPGMDGMSSEENDSTRLREQKKIMNRITHSVPHLEFDLFVFDRDHPGTELDTDREIMDWLETLVRELE